MYFSSMTNSFIQILFQAIHGTNFGRRFAISLALERILLNLSLGKFFSTEKVFHWNRRRISLAIPDIIISEGCLLESAKLGLS
jgi:hypothetical protein